MKHKVLLILPILVIFISGGWQSFAQQKIVLDDFQLVEEGSDNYLSATVPGVLQSDLIREGIIPHHFIGGNEDSVQWVNDRNWLYSTHFSLTGREIEGAKDYRLLMEWVDTYSEIYLNGAIVGTTENLFRSYDFSVKEFLREGENHLVIRFLSPTKVAHEQYLATGFNYPADNDRNDIKYSPFVRKSPYHFGWDWGPRMISMGMGSAPVLYRMGGEAMLSSEYIRTEIEWSDNGSAQQATIFASTRVKLATGRKVAEEDILTLTLRDPKGRLIAKKSTVGDLNETTDYTITAEVKDPQLWMPNGWGSQPLYTLICTLSGPGYKEERETHFGIREVRLLQEEDSYGRSFTFMVNNKPLYVKGANYLPHDRRFGGGGKTLEQLFRDDLVPAHFNMLRVWGGGTYETEEFYSLADKYGILIWQDFPFACTTYPNDPEFRANVSAEVRDQIGRIRNHPSLAFLCGNNEVLEGLKHWGWKEKYGYSDEVWQKMFEDYDSFFHRLLPNLVAEISPHVQYMHGSPYDSNWGIPESFLSSDSHNWRVWFGGKDFTEFDINPGRFASEYGFQSFPEMKTIQTFAPGYDLDTLTIESPILKHRQRSFIGNQRISDYMERNYPVPSKFSDYVYVGQLLHGRGMGYAIRALRRAYPLNMGSLYWQLNDVWPTVSWSSIDYWGNYKALQYEVKRAYAPYIIDLVEQPDGGLSLWIASDNIAHSGELTIEMVGRTFNGQELLREKYTADIGHAPFSEQIVSLPKSKLLYPQSFVELYLKDKKGRILASQLYYPTKPKEMQLTRCKPMVHSFRAEEGKVSLTISSRFLIYGLFIGTPEWQGARYSDNYFDLLPHTMRTITIHHPSITADATMDQITFTSLNEIL
ncbi:MAG: glycoside hydrolase family 2 TIM barrel-domain containing protein [Porphyromonas sp.]|nr:glycoside hydrolase family 2 TIM barrel-domain containing protein [Porphyromonas sp.]